MASSGSSAVPTDVIESLESICAHYAQVESNLKDILAAWDRDVLAELDPLDRAYAFLTLAKSVATLYTLQMRCSGESPEESPFKKELERVELYANKVEYYIDMSKARPTTRINAQAATRFIEHSLPDLTPGQRSDMRIISKGKGSLSTFQETSGNKKKRKHEISGKQSVAAAAAEFLAKASKELFGGVTPAERFVGVTPVERVEEEASEEGEIVED